MPPKSENKTAEPMHPETARALLTKANEWPRDSQFLPPDPRPATLEEQAPDCPDGVLECSRKELWGCRACDMTTDADGNKIWKLGLIGKSEGAVLAHGTSNGHRRHRRGDETPFAAMYVNVGHVRQYRCLTCSLGPDGHPRMKSINIAHDTLQAHLRGGDHLRRATDGRLQYWQDIMYGENEQYTP